MSTSDGWIDDELWATIEKLVPIVCVDVLPWRRNASGHVEVCLIQRADAAGDSRLNLVGGRVRYNELLSDAIQRHILGTLGESVTWLRSDFSQPEYAGQYPTHKVDGVGIDPRHHAIAFSYGLEIIGSPVAHGEAQALKFFAIDDLPPIRSIGFAQHHVIHSLAESIHRLTNT